MTPEREALLETVKRRLTREKPAPVLPAEWADILKRLNDLP